MKNNCCFATKFSLPPFIVLCFWGISVLNAQDFWTPTTESGSPRVWSLAASNQGTLYASNDDGRVRYTTDDGDSWHLLGMRVTDQFVLHVAVNSHGDVFATTANDHIWPYNNYRLYRTTDNGASWLQLNPGFSDYLSVIAIDQSNAIFVGTLHGVVRSTDNGTTWMPPDPQMASAWVLNLAIGSNGSIFAATDGSGIYRSTDGGASWGQINSGLTSNRFEAVAILPGGAVFVGPYGDPGAYRSTDNGDTWQKLSGGIENRYLSGFIEDSPGTILAGTSLGIFCSTDSGTSWQQRTAGIGDNHVVSITQTPEGSIFCGTWDNGVYRSQDHGNTWQPVNSNFTFSLMYSLLVHPDGDIFIGTLAQGVKRSTDGGATWSSANTGLENVDVLTMAYHPTGILFAGTYTSGLMKSTDNGSTWTSVSSYNGDRTIRCIELNSAGNIYVGTEAQGLFESTDIGVTWHRIFSQSHVYRVNKIIFDADGRILIATENGAYRSGDDGATWDTLSPPIFSGFTPNYLHTMIVNRNGYLFISSLLDGVHRSTDDGATWIAANSGFPDPLLVWSFVSNADGALFAGTMAGVYRSIDNGENWTDANAGLSNSQIQTFAIDSSAHILAGTPAGIFRSIQTTLSDLAVNPLTVHFGQVMAGAQQTNTIVLRNRSGRPLDITTISSPSSQFSVSPTSVTLAGYESKSLSVSFNPSTSGPQNIDLIFSHDGLNSPVTIKLEGEGLQAETQSLSYDVGWNLVSVPLNPTDSRKTLLFPSAASEAFAYQNAYVQKNVLEHGVGYWVKFNEPSIVTFQGIQRISDTISVSAGWNMIGSVSSPVSVATIGSIPPRIVTSAFFGYGNQYVTTNSLEPGRGYWVRAQQSGRLVLSSSQTARNLIRIQYTSELPPPAPKADLHQGHPLSFSLDQNYPNPFNPGTSIHYSLPENAHVTLKVYDMLGREVKALVDEFQTAGYKTAEFDASRLPSGVYCYKLNAAAFVMMKKMVLTK